MGDILDTLIFIVTGKTGLDRKMTRYTKEHKDEVCPNCGKGPPTFFDHFGIVRKDTIAFKVGTEIWCDVCCSEAEYQASLEGEYEWVNEY